MNQITIPDKLSKQLEEEAKNHNITVEKLIKKIFTIGLVAIEVEKNSDLRLAILEGNIEKEIKFW